MRLGQAECGSMPNYHLCALATFAALNKREAVEQGAGKQAQEQGSRSREAGAGSREQLKLYPPFSKLAARLGQAYQFCSVLLFRVGNL